MTDPITTIDPDSLAERNAATDELYALVFAPGGQIQKLPFGKLLAKLIAANLVKADEAVLRADLAHGADSVALVFNDPVALKNGWWRKIGEVGSGDWLQFEELSTAVRAAALAYAERAEGAAAVVSGSAADIASLKERLPAPFRIVPMFHGTYSHAIVSENGFVLAWIERATGNWLIGLSDALPVPEGWRAALLAGVQFRSIGNFSGYLEPVLDSADKLLGGWKKDGTFKAALSPDSIIPTSLFEAQISAILAAPAYQNGGVSGPDIACIGDSLTASAGATAGNSYPAVLATLSGRTVHNLGVGGETARTIAGRVGGWPYMVTVSGGVIPESGSVVVTLTSLDGLLVQPLLQGSSSLTGCTVAGVEITLSLNRTTGVYSITRLNAGAAVTANYPIPLVTDAQRTRMGDILLLDLGQNGGFDGDGDGDSDSSAEDIDQLLSMHDAIFANQNRAVNRGLVLGRTTSTLTARAPLHNAMQRRYGARFVNVLAYLSTYAALERAGVTPTAGDDSAIAAGSIPPSFLSDAIHLNDAGYAQKAYIVHERLLQLGWL